MVREHDAEYVAARRVLLDALEALGPHRKAVVLVGAQAIYHRVGAGNLLVAEFTTDGDLALNPDVGAMSVDERYERLRALPMTSLAKFLEPLDACRIARQRYSHQGLWRQLAE